jgi:SPX domain protein involved in polyphosphate accumulation
LKLRLKTLIDKKKIMQSRSETTSKISATYITLQEGFQQFEHDLNKLQQFVEINATAFSKILKKVCTDPGVSVSFVADSWMHSGTNLQRYIYIYIYYMLCRFMGWIVVLMPI